MKIKSIRIRRIMAFLMDYVLLFLPCILLSTIAVLVFGDIISLFIACTALVTSFVCFILRDYIFNGRSIGKRFYKLAVLGADTLSVPSSKQLIVKGLLLFLLPFDSLFLVFSGKSLGERTSATIVTCQQPLPDADPADLDSQKQTTSTKKRILVAVAIALCFSLVLILIVSAGLNAVKKQENYRIAYEYLVNSDAFSEAHAKESQITLTGYSSETSLGKDDASTVVTFTFRVQKRHYQVICHRDNDGWYVCQDCTDFH